MFEMATRPAVHVDKRDCVLLLGEECDEMDLEYFAVVVFDMSDEVGERIVVLLSGTPGFRRQLL